MANAVFKTSSIESLHHCGCLAPCIPGCSMHTSSLCSYARERTSSLREAGSATTIFTPDLRYPYITPDVHAPGATFDVHHTSCTHGYHYSKVRNGYMSSDEVSHFRTLFVMFIMPIIGATIPTTGRRRRSTWSMWRGRLAGNTARQQ